MSKANRAARLSLLAKPGIIEGALMRTGSDLDGIGRSSTSPKVEGIMLMLGPRFIGERGAARTSSTVVGAGAFVGEVGPEAATPSLGGSVELTAGPSEADRLLLLDRLPCSSSSSSASSESKIEVARPNPK